MVEEIRHAMSAYIMLAFAYSYRKLTVPILVSTSSPQPALALWSVSRRLIDLVPKSLNICVRKWRQWLRMVEGQVSDLLYRSKMGRAAIGPATWPSPILLQFKENQ